MRDKIKPDKDMVTILIAEDSPTQAEKLKYLLEQHRYKVDVANNGKQALVLLGKHTPTLVISDIIMPEMDGYELCKQIKSDERTQNIPVILLTSLSDSGDVLDGLACGADNFITKPYKDEYLISIIGNILSNITIRKSERVRIGMELIFGGKRRFISADQQQMLTMLISTYEAAVQRNTELVKTQNELSAMNDQLEQKVDERTRKITELNSIIRAVRNINQLITREKDRDRLMQRSCECLREIRGFNHAWIALINESGKFVSSAETGLGKKFLPLVEWLKRGDLPECARRALVQPDVVIIEDTSTCGDCPLAESHANMGSLSIRLEHGEKIYGILTISMPIDIINNKDVQNMFPEVAGDLGFALYSLQLEEKHKQAEEEIRSQAKFIGENTSPVLRVLKDGTILFANKVAEGILKYCNNTLPNTMIKIVSDIFSSGRRENIEYGCGEQIFSLTVVPIAEYGYINIYGSDITELKRMEEALRESEEIFRLFMEYSPIYVFIKDEKVRSIRLSKNYEKMLGKPLQEILGKSMDELFPSELAKSMIEDDLRVLRDCEPIKVIEELNGRVYETIKFPIMKQGSPSLIAGFTVDITDRKHADEERIRLATAIEHLDEYIIITDKEGTIQYVNPAFKKITGYTREEAIGQNPRMLKSGKHDEAHYEEMWNTILSGKIWKGHLINKKKDGTFYEENASISPIKDSTGNITNYVAVKRDVTNELLSEQRIRESQKMEAIGVLAGGIAHDFNNILSGIIGYTELSLDTVPKGSQLHSDLTRIFKAGYRARDLVNQILTFSRQREQEKRPIMIAPIIKESLKLLRASLPSNIEIRQNIESELEMVMADPTQIHQLIMNLCTNAGHAMREKGGTLEVCLSDIELDTEFCIQHPGLNPGLFLKLMVSDTGHGILPEVLPRIFEPFFTTKDKTGGTGLGLSVVHGIVTGCGGTVTVYSEPGKGTTFKVYLPVTTQKPVSEVEKTTTVLKGHEHILLVDDEQDIVDVGKRILEQLGYTVTTMMSSMEALELFQIDPHQFDLVISDMTMPFMTGDELAEEFMRIRQDIPVIICTGYSEKLTEEKALSIGIRAYLGKPLLKSEMAETVRKVLDQQSEDT